MTTSARAARAAAASWPALAKRSSGRFAMAVRTTSSSLAGSPGTSSEGRGGGSRRCAAIVASTPSATNGTRPVSAWNRRQPRQYTSVRASTGSPRICSGAR